VRPSAGHPFIIPFACGLQELRRGGEAITCKSPEPQTSIPHSHCKTAVDPQEMATGAERDLDPAAVAKTVEDALPEAPGEATTKLASPAASTSTSTALVLEEEEALKASMLGSDEKFRSLADAQRFAEDCNELDRRMEKREQLQQNLTGGTAAMRAGRRVKTQVCSLACVQHIRAAREYLVPRRG
jgi:hypothetical protein